MSGKERKASYSVRPIGWDDDAGAHIARAASHVDPVDQGAALGWYEAEFKVGRLALIGGYLAGVRVATCAYRIDASAAGLEFVILALGGAPGADTMAHFWPVVELIAREAGCKSVRFHTTRAGLGRYMEREGFRLSETIFRKDLG